MNSESLGTYQRPLHIFKYMHLHEYMKGKQTYAGAPGVLGAGAAVRDAKRTLHIGSPEEQEMKLSADRVRFRPSICNPPPPSSIFHPSL